MFIDTKLFELIHALAGRSPVGDAALVFFARVLPYFLAIGFFAFLADVRGFRARFFVFAQTALAVLLARGIATEVLAHYFYRARPFETLGFSPLITETSSSMPSGHAALFFALACAMWYVSRRWGAAYLFSASVMALARIACGVHYPSDIVAGAAIGIASAYVVAKALAPYDPALREKAKEASSEELSPEAAVPLNFPGEVR